MRKQVIVKQSKRAFLYVLLLCSFYYYQGCGSNDRNPLTTDVPAIVTFDMSSAVTELLAAYPTETGISSIDIYYTESTGVADRPVSFSSVPLAATAVTWTLGGTAYPPTYVVTLSLPSGKIITLKFIFRGNSGTNYVSIVEKSFTAGSTSITVSTKGTGGITIPLPKANTAPTISSISSTYSKLPATSGATTTLTCNASDADNHSLVYTWSFSGFSTGVSLSSTTSNPTELSVKAGGASGTITVTCKASDLADSATKTKDIRVSGSGVVTMPGWW